MRLRRRPSLFVVFRLSQLGRCLTLDSPATSPRPWASFQVHCFLSMAPWVVVVTARAVVPMFSCQCLRRSGTVRRRRTVPLAAFAGGTTSSTSTCTSTTSTGITPPRRASPRILRTNASSCPHSLNAGTPSTSVNCRIAISRFIVNPSTPNARTINPATSNRARSTYAQRRVRFRLRRTRVRTMALRLGRRPIRLPNPANGVRPSDLSRGCVNRPNANISGSSRIGSSPMARSRKVRSTSPPAATTLRSPTVECTNP